jgi:predicted ester cyclase
MTSDELKSRAREGFERMFGEGDLAYIDAAVAPGAVDHQEPEGTDMAAHLKEVVRTLREAFPDLHFELHEVLCEGDVVACRSTMTGTQDAPLRIGPLGGLPVVGTTVEVPHMHFFRYDDAGRVTDLWHVWDTLGLARQLGAPAPDLRVAL